MLSLAGGETIRKSGREIGDGGVGERTGGGGGGGGGELGRGEERRGRQYVRWGWGEETGTWPFKTHSGLI